MDDYQVVMTVITAIVFPVSYLLQPILISSINSQNNIQVTEAKHNKKETVKLIIFQLLFAGGIFSVSWFLGDLYFRLFAGGYLISILVGIMLLIQNILYFRGLSISSAASGQIKFSDEYGYKNLSNRLFATGLFCLSIFLILGEVAFAGACVFIFGSSRGYMRRAKQVIKNT